MQFCGATGNAARILLVVGITLANCVVSGQNSDPAWAPRTQDSSSDLRLEMTPGGTPLHFQLQIKNISNRDLLLNLGYAIGDNRYPSAIQLQLTEPEGSVLVLDLAGPPIVASPIDPLAVPLPAESSYSLPLNLGDYVALRDKLLYLILVPGEYKINAIFTGSNGFREPGNHPAFRYWEGTATSNDLEFKLDRVVPYASNKLLNPSLSLPTDKEETLPSPDRQWALVAGPITSRTISLEDRSNNTHRFIREYDRSVTVGWSSGSQGFFVNDAYSSNLEDAYLYWVHSDQPLKLNDLIFNRDKQASEIAKIADHAYFRVLGWYSADAIVVEYCGHSGQEPAKQFDYFYRVTSIGHSGTEPSVLRISHTDREADSSHPDCSL
jgi:hypothetical protein